MDEPPAKRPRLEATALGGAQPKKGGRWTKAEMNQFQIGVQQLYSPGAEANLGSDPTAAIKLQAFVPGRSVNAIAKKIKTYIKENPNLTGVLGTPPNVSALGTRAPLQCNTVALHTTISSIHA